MATTTPNINLAKPVVTDNFDLATWNSNMDKIDSAAGDIPSTSTFNLTAASAAYTLQVTEGTKFGNVCICSFRAVSSASKSPNGTKIATVPTGYRPIHQERICIFATNDWSSYQSGWIDINPNGEVLLNSQAGTAWFGQATWVTA